MPRTARIFLYVLATMVAICLAVEIYCQEVLHLGYPYNWPLMFPDPSFFDFTAYHQQFSRFHTNAFFQGPWILMYPAPVIVCYWFFYSLKPVSTPIFLGFILTATAVAAAMVARALMRRGIAARYAIVFIASTYLLAYPLWFEFKQANTEIVTWVALTLGVLAFANGRNWTAATLIGIAGAFKFYPIIYLGLLLSRKLYRQCILGCLVAVAVTLGSLWFVGPTIPDAWHGTQIGLAMFRKDYMLVLRPHEVGFDHSMFNVVKKVGWLAARLLGQGSGLPEQFRSPLLSCYLAVAASAGILIYALRIRFLPLANQVLCICIAAILLPPTSFDYTLMHLYVPLTLLFFLSVKAERAGARVPGLAVTFALLGLAVSPLSELIKVSERVGGSWRALILFTIFILSLRFRFDLPAAERNDPLHTAPNLNSAG